MKSLVQVTLFFLLSLATVLHAAPADTDPSFSGDGKVVYDIYGYSESVKAMALQADGKVVAVGRTYSGPNTYGFIMRLKTDGSLDPAFNGGGLVVVSAFQLNAVVIQPDGAIVAGGIMTNYNDFALFRYDSGGNPDSSFGTNGAVYTDFSTGEEQIQALALQPDGKIIAAGQSGFGDYVISRYTTTGQPDSTFGTAGVQKLSVSSTEATLGGIIIQSTGKIVLAGSAQVSGVFHFTLKRLNSNGTPDLTFADTNMNFYGKNDYVSAVVRHADDGFTVAGTAMDLSNVPHLVLTEFGAEGSYLRENNLIATANMGGKTIAIRPDGKYMVGGYSGSNLATLRFNPNLGLDNTFGSNGVATFDFSATYSDAYAVLIQADGKVVAGGDAKLATQDLAFLRLSGNGAALLDDDFSGGAPAWNTISGNWVETNGTLTVTALTKALAFAPTPWTPSGSSACSQCTILFPITMSGGDQSKVIVYGWYQDKDNSVQIILKPDKGKVVIKQTSYGSKTKASVKQTFVPGLTYNIALGYDGEWFHLTVNGSEILQFYRTSDPTGNVGFKVANTTAQIGHIYIF